MANTVKAKILLGWMSQHEALRVLNKCYFDEHLGKRKAIQLWRTYRDRVQALPPMNLRDLPRLPMTDVEQQAVREHECRIRLGSNVQYLSEIAKIHPSDLIARQLEVIVDQCQRYAPEMQDERQRINMFLGIGLRFPEKLIPKQVSRKRSDVNLPHFEFVPKITPDGVEFQERDRYVLAIPTPDNRLVLWGGYHRTHTFLSQTAGDAAAVAPLLTVMHGIPEVDTFFARRSDLRDAVLCDRPPLLRDFLDDRLFITANLQKQRAIGRVEEIRPGEYRAGVIRVNDDS